MVATKVADLKAYMALNMNILLQGLHGTGKTTMLKQAAEQLGWKMKVFNTASMDPFTDFVGVPKFITLDDGTEALKSIRPREIDEADVVFFDELNRADPRVTNAVLEIIQFRTVNGDPLHNLKCVVAAQNPPTDEYDVQPLDPALVDRFDLTFDVTPTINVSYLASKFDRKIAMAIQKWYRERPANADYISPRRMEIIGNVFTKTRSRNAVNAAFPSGGTFDSGKLFNMMTEAVSEPIKAKKDEQTRIIRMNTVTGSRMSSKELEKIINHLNNPSRVISYNEIRAKGPKVLSEVMQSSSLLTKGRENIVNAIKSQISPADIVANWQDVFEKLTKFEAKFIVNSWSYSKKMQVSRVMAGTDIDSFKILKKYLA